MVRIHLRRVLVEPEASVVHTDGSGATLRIEGLVCSACAARVRRRLEQVDGVASAGVDLGRGEARVIYDDEAPSAPETLVGAVEGAVILRPLRRVLSRLSARRPAARAGTGR